MHIKGSIKIGELIIRIPIARPKSLHDKIPKNSIPPKKVLPESPMKIFAGLQFQIKNPIKLPQITK